MDSLKKVIESVAKKHGINKRVVEAISDSSILLTRLAMESGTFPVVKIPHLGFFIPRTVYNRAMLDGVDMVKLKSFTIRRDTRDPNVYYTMDLGTLIVAEHDDVMNGFRGDWSNGKTGWVKITRAEAKALLEEKGFYKFQEYKYGKRSNSHGAVQDSMEEGQAGTEAEG